MAKRQIFYSFHYANDVMRVQQIRNIGMLEDNSPVSPNEWEKIKRSGDREIEKWIDDNMKYRSCVVVLIGTETASRTWVQYEIKKEMKKLGFGQISGQGLDEYFSETKRFVDARRYEGNTKIYDTKY